MNDRETLLDNLLGFARAAFYMVVPEVEQTGRIGAPFRTSIGPQGSDMGRMYTDRPATILADELATSGKPGVAAYTEGEEVILLVLAPDGVLAKVAVPFSLSGRRFPDPVEARVIEVGVDGYDGQRVLDHLLPLIGTTDASHDVDPSSLEPVLLPDPAVVVKDQLRAAQMGKELKPSDASFLKELEPQRRKDAPHGLVAVWYEVTRIVEPPADGLSTYRKELAAGSPLLAAMAERAGFDDSELVTALTTDATMRIKYLGDIRGVFDFVPGGKEALQELLGILKLSLGDTPGAAAAVDKVGGRLSLVNAMAGCRRLGCLALVVGFVLFGLAGVWLLMG